MFFAALIASVLALTSAKPAKRAGSCSKEMAAIAYEPCGYWCNYMRGISRELKDIAVIYDTPMATPLIQAFQNKYQVYVQINEPIGEEINYGEVPPVEVTKQNFGHNDSRSVLNLGTFKTNTTDYIYSFLSFAPTGLTLGVNIFRPIDISTYVSPQSD